jgi:hypothetical protein
VTIAPGTLGLSDCEAHLGGLLGQPANSLSTVAFGVVALWLLGRRERTWVTNGMALTLLAVGLGSFLYHGPAPQGAVIAHDAGIVAAAGLVLVLSVSAVRSVGPRLAARAMTAALALLAFGWVLHALGRTGSVLCDPNAWLQPHAAWHLLSAVGLGLLAVRTPRRTSRVSAGSSRKGPSSTT